MKCEGVKGLFSAGSSSAAGSALTLICLIDCQRNGCGGEKQGYDAKSYQKGSSAGAHPVTVAGGGGEGGRRCGAGRLVVSGGGDGRH